MKSYAQILQEDRRLQILRILQESPSYQVNEHLLQEAMRNFGHAVSRDLLRTELTWLAEQRYIELKTIADVRIPVMNQRGLDVARGSIEVEGVKRPDPS